MVCARHSKVHELLAVAFAERRVQKTYRAIVCGRFKEAHFELITGHARHPKDRKRFSTLFPSPETEKSSIRRAHSEFRGEGEGGGLSALTVHLHTGRTHQIRAHLSDVGHPLWGDTLYGGSKYRLAPQASSEIKKGARLLKRHALHAFELGLPNRSEANDKPFRAEMPEDFAALWRALVME